MTRQPLAQAEIARRRTEIHQAARAVIAAAPYSATLVNQLVTKSGYDRRMIFRCYRNKEEIFGDVLREEYARWCTMSLKALLPFNEEKIRQHLIRYTTNEPRLAHLIAGLPAILAGLVSGRQAQLLNQLDALAAPAGSELDARLPFFMPGYGRRVAHGDAAGAGAGDGARRAEPRAASRGASANGGAASRVGRAHRDGPAGRLAGPGRTE